MIWHIFKKDLKLLWVYGLTVAILPFAIVGDHLKMDHLFTENEALSSLLMLLEMMLYFGVAALTALLVHQDALVGVRQDWLARPVRRRDLLTAKLLFILLAAQAPLFVASLAGGLIDGFAFSSSLTAAATENLYFLLGFTLPVFALSSLTKDLTEALAGAFVLFIAVFGLEALVAGLYGGAALGPTSDTSIAWIPLTERFLIYLTAAVAILGLQYFRRATSMSRYVFGGAVVLCFLTEVAPWRYAFAFEKVISAAPVADPSLSFEPSLGRFHSPVSDGEASSDEQFNGNINLRVTPKGAEIYLPLEVSGVAGGSILKIDRAAVHLLGANGKDEGDINPPGDLGDFEIRDEGAADSPRLSYYEPVHIRSSIFNRVKDQAVTVRIDFSVTMLRLASTDRIASIGADERIAGVGWCETELNDERTAVEVRCLAAGNLPQCSTVLLENPATGAHNPPIYGCRDDYSPYFGRYKPPDLIETEGANLYFRDAAGLVHYPVDASQVGNACVVMKSYAVAGHFSMHLTIPAIRLADWSAF